MTRQRMRDVASALKLACREVEQNLRAHQRGGWRAGGGAG
jgi:hypothetical protein